MEIDDCAFPLLVGTGCPNDDDRLPDAVLVGSRPRKPLA
jgi:hypothetical protein